MSDCEQFEAWMRDTYGPGVNLVCSDDGYISTVPHRIVRMTYASVEMLWEAWQAARAQSAITSETGNQAAQGASAITSESAQAEHDCDCGRKWKRTAYGWASTEPAQAGALLTDDEIDAAYEKARGDYQRSRFAIRGQQLTAQDSPDWWFARAIEQAVRSKLGAGVPMTREDRYDAFTAAERAAGENISPWSFDQGVRAAERFHGIVGKEGGNAITS